MKYVNSINRYLKKFLKENSKNLIIFYGLTTIYLFSIWSVSTLWDLPIKKVFLKNYDRKSLTREYILSMNAVLTETKKPPSKKFEKEWENIELENNDSYLFLANSPRHYAYFMNKGLLKSSKNFLLKEIKNKQEQGIHRLVVPLDGLLPEMETNILRFGEEIIREAE